MLFRFADSSQKKIVKYSLYLQSIVCIGVMCFLSFPEGLFVGFAALIALIYYFYQSKKIFGGVTGDTSGYFVLLCEAYMIIIAACIDIIR